MDYLCYLCLAFVMLSRLFIAALLSSAGKGLTSWLSSIIFNCVFVTFPCGVLEQVWHLIVSIPDLCYLFTLLISTNRLTVESPGTKPDCKDVMTLFVFKKLKTCLCTLFPLPLPMY